MCDSPESKEQLRCCLGCGRDTTDDYCTRCIGHTRRRYRDRLMHIADKLPLEDDYSEESDADSVCDDNSDVI